jgi:hypothetical protein
LFLGAIFPDQAAPAVTAEARKAMPAITIGSRTFDCAKTNEKNQTPDGNKTTYLVVIQEITKKDKSLS